MIQISRLYEKAKENNQASGIIIYILITFLLIAINPGWYGLYMLKDLEYLVGAIVGILFALKNRNPDQRPIKFGIITGLVGGVLASIAPAFYIVIFFHLGIFWIIIYMGLLSITGIALGLIIGAILGWYYNNKDIREKEDDTISDDFFQDLIEK